MTWCKSIRDLARDVAISLAIVVGAVVDDWRDR